MYKQLILTPNSKLKITKMNHAIHFTMNDKKYFVFKANEYNTNYIRLYEKTKSGNEEINYHAFHTYDYSIKSTDVRDFKKCVSVTNNDKYVVAQFVSLMLEIEFFTFKNE